MRSKFQLRALCYIWVSPLRSDPIRPQKLDYVAAVCRAKTREKNIHICRNVKMSDSEESTTDGTMKLWQIDLEIVQISKVG